MLPDNQRAKYFDSLGRYTHGNMIKEEDKVQNKQHTKSALNLNKDQAYLQIYVENQHGSPQLTS